MPRTARLKHKSSIEVRQKLWQNWRWRMARALLIMVVIGVLLWGVKETVVVFWPGPTTIP
ncbi:MAG: hypothetical protein NTY66_04050 [Candidatus Vogelbacteria bacterium]|nr:hypothetical protein [Candidatus Vogelbacteria bacterium]